MRLAVDAGGSLTRGRLHKTEDLPVLLVDPLAQVADAAHPGSPDRPHAPWRRLPAKRRRRLCVQLYEQGHPGLPVSSVHVPDQSTVANVAGAGRGWHAVLLTRAWRAPSTGRTASAMSEAVGPGRRARRPGRPVPEQLRSAASMQSRPTHDDPDRSSPHPRAGCRLASASRVALARRGLWAADTGWGGCLTCMVSSVACQYGRRWQAQDHAAPSGPNLTCAIHRRLAAPHLWSPTPSGSSGR